jgi:DNA-binding winged helix-turn-helix (wHTH) protein
MSIAAYPSGLREEALSFDRFCLLPRRRILLKAGRPVRLGARAMSILIELTARAGQVVPERDLISLVWSGSLTESGTLRVHIASLRRALGRSISGVPFIKNRPGEGYLFGEAVETSVAATGGSLGTPRRAEFLPRPPTSMVGRDEAIEHLLNAVDKNQLVTVTGSAGIGKTRLAVAIGERAVERDYLPYFIDFSTLSDPTEALDTVASAIGLPVRQGRLVETIVALIGTTRALLILDNCEHVLQPVRAIAEQARKSNSDVRPLGRVPRTYENLGTVRPIDRNADNSPAHRRSLHVSTSRVRAATESEAEARGRCNVRLHVELRARGCSAPRGIRAR